MDVLEKCLLPQEMKLRRQERLRKLWGVKEVSQPTYQKYITGPIKRFNSQANAFAAMKPDNPLGTGFRAKYLEKTGSDWFSKPLPYDELDNAKRVTRALEAASWRVCTDYNPEPLPITPEAGRVNFADPAQAARLVKKLAMWFGAEMVKITELDQRWVYEDVDISHRYAIVCVVPHHLEMNRNAPSFISGTAVADTYSRLKFITTRLADFIRGMGYDAAIRETLGWAPEMLMVPIAIDAGVGEFCRNGRVMSPEWGNNMRLKAVTTDLPLALDMPVSFNAHRFCSNCENCAEYCPSGAVPKGEPTEAPDSMFANPGYKKWYVRAERCLYFWSRKRTHWITCGGRCLSVCPWNKPHNLYHHLMRAVAVRAPGRLVRWLVKGDRIVERRSKKLPD